MQKRTIFCDHCGKEINPFAEYSDLEIELNHIAVETDLCGKCFNELCDIVKDFCKKGSEQNAQ